MMTKSQYENKALEDALKAMPSGLTFEEKQQHFARCGFKAKIDKFRHVAADDFDASVTKNIKKTLPGPMMTREQIRQSAFIFKLKKDNRFQQCLQNMPPNLKKRQRAEYWKRCGYCVKEILEKNYERKWIIFN
ncbi:MAG: hypothetical protein K2Q45_02480 [Nitrosomonas sp.]|nr:hypothetical protein [Nitrosomonas sp.]